MATTPPCSSMRSKGRSAGSRRGWRTPRDRGITRCLSCSSRSFPRACGRSLRPAAKSRSTCARPAGTKLIAGSAFTSCRTRRSSCRSSMSTTGRRRGWMHPLARTCRVPSSGVPAKPHWVRPMRPLLAPTRKTSTSPARCTSGASGGSSNATAHSAPPTVKRSPSRLPPPARRASVPTARSARCCSPRARGRFATRPTPRPRPLSARRSSRRSACSAAP